MCKNDMHLVGIKLQLKPLSFSILTMKRIGNIIVSYRIRSPRFMIKKTLMYKRICTYTSITNRGLIHCIMMFESDRDLIRNSISKNLIEPFFIVS